MSLTFLGHHAPKKKSAPSIEQLQPTRVLAHRGDYHDFHARFRAAAKLAVELGKPGLGKIAPYLHQYATDNRNLRIAWDHLVAHGGTTSGPDKLRYSDIAKHQIWPFLSSLSLDIRQGDYSPSPEAERVVKIPKTSGNGYRPLVLQNIEHRIVQRAVVEVLQPLLDPRFDGRSFGFRPRRGPQQALATAESIFRLEDRGVWITADIRDAFTCVPLPRLMQVVRKYVKSENMVGQVERIVSGSKVPGLRQGGSLSPLLLNLYLHHHLDGPWRKLHPDIPLIRYADDILLLCQSRSEAKIAYDDLATLLEPAGMTLKGDRKTSIQCLTSKSPAEWLGFRVQKNRKSLKVTITEEAWNRLEDELRQLAEEGPSNANRVLTVIAGWFEYLGPCYRSMDTDEVCGRISSIAAKLDLNTLPSQSDWDDLWLRSHQRWNELRKLIAESVP